MAERRVGQQRAGFARGGVNNDAGAPRLTGCDALHDPNTAWLALPCASPGMSLPGGTLVTAGLGSPQADNRDLQQAVAASGMVTGLLNRGLGRLGLTSSGTGSGHSRLSDYPAVLIFVVGGVSAAEARAVRGELEQHTFGHKPRVVLGGTALLTPEDAVRQLLAK